MDPASSIKPLHKLIIDTDPGVDDTLALLLALAAKPEELEVMLISVTYGNVELESCLRNVVALFHVIDKEMEWRRSQGRIEGFQGLKTFKPIVAVGAEHALEEELLMADYFHGKDGLAGVHESFPQHSPDEHWKSIFKAPGDGKTDVEGISKSFRPSHNFAHKEIIRLLRENPENTITIIAVGPLTNLALAAAEDPEAFLRVKEVVVMGGAIDIKGNITPVAEFNTYADAVATARVFALTSPMPSSTMPPIRAEKSLPAYPSKLSQPLNLTLFPLDITTPHNLFRSTWDELITPFISKGSPLAAWTQHFLQATFDKINSHSAYPDGDPGLSLHDPLCVWYMLTRYSIAWHPAPKGPEDIRVETTGQWTRGMHVVDRRNRKKVGAKVEQVKSPGALDITNPMDDLVIGANEEVPGDTMAWLSANKGNRIRRIVSSPGELDFGPYLVERIFGDSYYK